MCGIVGYVGEKAAASFLLEGLRRLEYRGYDSAGIAVLEGGHTTVCKAAGRLAVLEEKVQEQSGNGLTSGRIGIGHTRWATHGGPTDPNAHPHRDCTGRFAVVHNGIIENYAALRQELQARGHRFASQTDSEVVAHLLEEEYQGDLLDAMRRVLGRIRGAFALGVIAESEPEKIIATRQDCPLIIGLGQGENFIASDIPPVLPYTRDVLVMEDGEIAVLTRDGVTVTDRAGNAIEKEILHVHWDAEAAEKGGYEHYMLKEMHEQPKALRDTMSSRIAAEHSRVMLDELGLTSEQARNVQRIAMVACGTAAHAGMVGKALIERWARIPVEWDVASEFRYRDPLIGPDTLGILVSQSGETADTLAAMREMKLRGSRTLAITNVVGSSLAREAHDVLFTWAGPEVAVASTKAYTTQLVALTLLALHLAQERGTLPPERIREVLEEMHRLPGKAEQALRLGERIRDIAAGLAPQRDFFFVGRGLDYAVALEGQLKLKEISYIHAEAYAAGELKHGTLALIEEGVPVVALVTQPDLWEKTVSNITEMRARGARVIAVAYHDDHEIAQHVDDVLAIPRTDPMLAPALAVLPLQLLAYHIAVARGCDVDKPRNLAKSVTVE